MGYMGYLPEWENTHYDFHALYAERLDQLFTKGYGIFAKYTAFMLKDHVIEPVLTPDPQRLSQLPAYETQRKKVIDNTLALIKGKPAANCLLYGDAGTGKSSTVKAVVNEFADRGLRLIELKKSQLHELPDVMDAIADNPLKFIIFIDDLSFSSDDADFGALKAVLEGSIASRHQMLSSTPPATAATLSRKALPTVTVTISMQEIPVRSWLPFPSASA